MVDTTVDVDELTDYGYITTGDKVVGEHVDGATVRLTHRIEVSEDTSPQLGGDLDLNGYNLNNISPTELNYLDGVLSQLAGISDTAVLTNKSISALTNTLTNIADAEIKAAAGIALNKLAATTSSRALVSDASGFVSPATTTSTEIGYVNGVTSAIQTQIDGKSPTAGNASLVTVGTVTAGTWNASIIGMAYGGSNAALTASNGGIIYSTATAMAVLAGTATAGQILRSGSSAAPAWSTATYPASTTANRILYSSATNTVNELTSANSGVLVTNGSGVPSIGTDIPTAVTIGSSYIYRDSGTDVTVADGGSGRSSATAYAVLCGGTTSTGAHQSIASVGTSGQVLTSNGAGALPTFQSLAGTGDVVGPASATDNAIARFDSTTGKLIQNSTVTVGDTGNFAGVGTFNTHTVPGGTGTIALTADIPVVATQANQETATSTTTFVSPGRQQFHPSAAKLWLECDAAGTIAVSYNVTSITDIGTGQLGITIGTDMSSTSYCCGASCDDASPSTGQVRNIQVASLATTDFKAKCSNASNTLTDPVNWMVWAFGDQ